MNQIDRYADPIDVDFAPVRGGELAMVDDTQMAIATLKGRVQEKEFAAFLHDEAAKGGFSDVIDLALSAWDYCDQSSVDVSLVDWFEVGCDLRHYLDLQIDNSYTDNSTYADNSYYNETDSHDITTYDNRHYFDDRSLVYTDSSSYVSYEEGDTTYIDNSTYAPVENHYYYVDQSDNSVIWVNFDGGTSEGEGSYSHTENHTHVNGWIFFYIGVVVTAIAVCGAGLRDYFYAPTITPANSAQEVQQW